MSSALPTTDAKFRPSRRSAVGFSSSSIPDKLRNDLIAVVGEFVGTYLFLLFAQVIAQISVSYEKSHANLGLYNANTLNAIAAAEGIDAAQYNNLTGFAGALGPTVTNVLGFGAATPELTSTATLMMIAMGFGFSVMVNVFIFFRITGAALNPAITLALALIGKCPPVRAVLVMVTQIIAGICSAATASALTPGPVYFDNALSFGCSRARGMWIEMFATSLLILAVMLMAVEKSRATHLAPLVIGFALFVGHLFAVAYTGAGLNPARSLGPAIVKHSFPSYHWIYWVGPILASLFTAGFYHFLKWIDYETCNPDADAEY